MSNSFGAQIRVNPSHVEPGIILTQTQASHAFRLLATGKPRVQISTKDLYVYVRHVDIRTDAQFAQSPGNFLPAAKLLGKYYSTATYMLRVRTEYDHHDIADAAEYNVALPEAQNLAMKQGILQAMRIGLLYGFNPQNGEGLLNTPGILAQNLPPDTNGDTTVKNYDAGQMALFLLGIVVQLMNQMYQDDPKSHVVIVGPQEIIRQLKIQNIVQLTSYQRPGAGSATTTGTIENVLGENGITVEFGYDDTLIGKGEGGTDLVLITIPEVDNPSLSPINTNIWGSDSQPSMNAVNIMYADMAAPRRIPTPIPDGGITELNEIRVTSGWCLRPQGLAAISMQYQ